MPGTSSSEWGKGAKDSFSSFLLSCLSSMIFATWLDLRNWLQSFILSFKFARCALLSSKRLSTSSFFSCLNFDISSVSSFCPFLTAETCKYYSLWRWMESYTLWWERCGPNLLFEIRSSIWSNCNLIWELAERPLSWTPDYITGLIHAWCRWTFQG